MISHLGVADFPISAEEAHKSLQVVAKQIHDRYRSPFTLVTILPRAKWFGIMLEELLVMDKAHVFSSSVGTAVRMVDERGRQFPQPQIIVIEPPSLHAIKNKKVVIFDSVGEWGTVSQVAMYIASKQPTSVEVGSFLSFGPLPKWVNPDYVCFEMSQDYVVSGLGVGRSEEEAQKGFLSIEPIKKEIEDEPVNVGSDGSGAREMQAVEQ